VDGVKLDAAASDAEIAYYEAWETAEQLLEECRDKSAYTAASRIAADLVKHRVAFQAARAARIAENERRKGIGDVESTIDQAFRRLPKRMQQRLLARWTA